MSTSNANENSEIFKKLKIALKSNGVVKGCTLINNKEINIIRKEINPFFKSVKNFANYSDRILRKTTTVFEVTDLCAVSESVARIILKDEILDIVKDYFGEDIRMGQFRFIKQIKPNNEPLLTHCDGAKAVLLMVSLCGQNIANGPTFFFKKSHKYKKEIKKVFIGEDQYNKNKSNINLYVASDLMAGDYVLFDVRTWHGRIPPKEPGREVIWLSFYPISNEENIFDSLFKQSSLARLSDKQMDFLGITNKLVNKQKHLEHQYLECRKSPSNFGKFGILLEHSFLKISNSYSYIKNIFSNLKSIFNFIRHKKNKKVYYLFQKNPQEKILILIR